MASERKSYALEQSPFFRLGTRRGLAQVLQIAMSNMKTLSGPRHLYSHFPAPKKNGGIRWVDNPREDLKKVQRRIAQLLGRITPPEFLFCPVKKRSYVTNAHTHAGNRVVHSLDVKSYFPSTPSWKVYGFFRHTLQCANDVAEVLTKIACCDGHLPTGSPLSPLLAYFAHASVWHEVARIAREHGCVVTVYIDDVTVSGAHVPVHVIWQIKEALHRGGLRYHKEKRAVDRRAEITGVIVRDGKLLVPNRQRAKLRALRQSHARARHPAEAMRVAPKINGLIGQAAQIASANTGTAA